MDDEKTCTGDSVRFRLCQSANCIQLVGIGWLFIVGQMNFPPKADCNIFSQHEQPWKTLSVEIRLHRDCDSRWVTDSALEVIIFDCGAVEVVYKMHKNNSEREGVLMVIAYDSIFGYVNIIIFQLSFWIIISESSEAVYEGLKNMLGFSYLAIPTRHTVRRVPYLHGI